MAIVLSGTTGIDAGSLPVSNCGNTEVEGNLNLSGVGTRITGDFSNATASNRVAFQTSTLNGATSPFFIPNGTGTKGQVVAGASSDASNSSYISIMADSSTGLTSLNSGASGTGTFLPMIFTTNGSERMRIETNGDVKLTTSPAQFDNDTSIATTAFIRQFGSQYSNVTATNVSLTGVVSHVGGVIYGNGTGNITYTLPSVSANSIPNGAKITIWNSSSNPMSIVTQGSDTLLFTDANSATGLTIKTGNYIELINVSGNWFVLGSGNNDFKSLLSSNGYQKLPSGLILQWGWGNSTATTQTITFPIAFPNNVLSVFATIQSTGGTYPITIEGKTLTQMTLYKNAANYAYWMAIGY